jgi:hypothetical protein
MIRMVYDGLEDYRPFLIRFPRARDGNFNLDWKSMRAHTFNIYILPENHRSN